MVNSTVGQGLLYRKTYCLMTKPPNNLLHRRTQSKIEVGANLQKAEVQQLRFFRLKIGNILIYFVHPFFLLRLITLIEDIT